MANSGAKTIAITYYDNNKWSLLQNNNSYYSTLIRDAGMTAFNGTMANLHETDYVIDVSPSQSFAYGYSTWLQLVGTDDQNTQVFTSKKNVFRIDGLTNTDGALGKVSWCWIWNVHINRYQAEIENHYMICASFFFLTFFFSLCIDWTERSPSRPDLAIQGKDSIQ